jgi:hypothetical protein
MNKPNDHVDSKATANLLKIRQKGGFAEDSLEKAAISRNSSVRDAG